METVTEDDEIESLLILWFDVKFNLWALKVSIEGPKVPIELYAF